MTEPSTDKAHRHDRPTAALTIYIVATGATGGVAGAGAAFGWRQHPALTAGALLLLTITVGLALGMYVNRSMARRAGVPAKSLRPLARRIQRADIPDSPQERAAMSRVLTQQRKSVEKLTRFHWAYRVLATVFAAGAVLQLLYGSIPVALVLLLAGALQLLQPLLARRAAGRLDRAEAGLGRREQAASRPPE